MPIPESRQPLSLSLLFPCQKRKKGCFVVYFLLRKAIAAATTAIMMMAAAIAMYVVVISTPAGGGAEVGEGETGCTGVWVGAIDAVGVGGVGATVGVTTGAAELFSKTANDVPALLP